MPATAEKALEGLLAEGTDAAAIIDTLTQAGYDIKPPEGDESYGEGAEAEGDAGMDIGILLGGGELPKAEGTEEPDTGEDNDPKPDAEGGDQKPLSLFQKRKKAAKSTRKKHGYPDESDDE